MAMSSALLALLLVGGSATLTDSTHARAADVVAMTCNTDASVLNTGRNQSTGAALTGGSEPLWAVAAGNTYVPLPPKNAPVSSFTPPPALSDIGTWQTPTVGKLAGVWASSPFGNANWIGHPSIPWYHYMYYKVSFSLSDNVNIDTFRLDLRGASDDVLNDVFVNGTSYLSTRPSQIHPISFDRIASLAELTGPWVHGENTIILAVYNYKAPSGLMVSNSGVPQCPAAVSVSKTVTSDATALHTGDTVQYRVEVANENINTTAADTLVADLSTSELQIDAWTCQASGTATCPSGSGSGDLSETVPTLPYVGQPRTNYLTYSVSATVRAAGEIVNTAQVTPTADTSCYDRDGGDACAATATVTVLPSTGGFSVEKVVEQVDGTVTVAPGTEFTVDYFVDGADAPAGSLTVTADGETVAGPQDIPVGSVITFAEREPEPVPYGQWGAPRFEDSEGVELASLTIERDANPTVTIVNPIAVDAHPRLSIVKATNGVEYAQGPGDVIATGDSVEWTYTVTNTGDVALDDVTVDDTFTAGDGSTGTMTATTTDVGPLAVGASRVFTASGTAVAGQYTNTATAHAIAVDDTGASLGIEAPPVSAESWYYGAAPGLSIEKKTNGTRYTSAPGAEIATGSEVTWTYTVTNTGDTVLDDVEVSDTFTAGDGSTGTLTPTATDSGPLAPGESRTFTASDTAIEGQYANTATATATAVDNTGEALTVDIAPATDTSWYHARTTAPGLAFTGGALPVGVAVTGSALLLVGALAVIVHRRRRRA